MSYSALPLSRPVKQLLMMLADALMIPLALWLSFALVNSSLFANNDVQRFLGFFVFAALISVSIFYKMGIYRTILLYMGLQSGLLILKSVTLATLALTAFVYATASADFPGPVLLIFWMISLLLVGGVRFMLKLFLQNLIQNFRPKEPVIIYGAGSSGMQLAAALTSGDQYLPVAFVDDSPALIGNTVQGLRVYSPASLGELTENFSVRQILLAI